MSRNNGASLGIIKINRTKIKNTGPLVLTLDGRNNKSTSESYIVTSHNGSVVKNSKKKLVYQKNIYLFSFF